MNTSILEESDLSENTITSYKSLIKKINEHIGNTRLKDIEGMKKVIESITNNPNYNNRLVLQ